MGDGDPCVTRGLTSVSLFIPFVLSRNPLRLADRLCACGGASPCACVTNIQETADLRVVQCVLPDSVADLVAEFGGDNPGSGNMQEGNISSASMVPSMIGLLACVVLFAGIVAKNRRRLRHRWSTLQAVRTEEVNEEGFLAAGLMMEGCADTNQAGPGRRVRFNPALGNVPMMHFNPIFTQSGNVELPSRGRVATLAALASSGDDEHHDRILAAATLNPLCT